MLTVGSQAPLLTLPVSPLLGKRLAVVFFPRHPSAELAVGLARFGEQLAALTDQGAAVVGVSDAAEDELRELVVAYHLPFPLASDPDRIAALAFGAAEGAAALRPAVYALDEAGIVRAVYDGVRYPNLPTPVAVARAFRKLNESPRPAPLSDQDWCLGPAGAPVTLIEYSDYQCERCQTLHAALEAVLHDLGDCLRLAHRHLPLRATHPLAQQAAEAAEAAGAQGRFWDMHHRLFAAQGALERGQLIAYAAELGLDVARFTAELDGRVHQEAVNEDFRRAVAGDIKLPPSLFINGVLYEGARTAAELRARIEAVLA